MTEREKILIELLERAKMFSTTDSMRRKIDEAIALVRGWGDYVLVPREPTEAMLSAGDSMMPQIAAGQDITTGYDALKDAWPAMVDAALSSASRATEAPRHTVIGKVSGKPREGDQVPGMLGAICHACGLGYKCDDIDCPNTKPNPMFGGVA